MTTLALLDTRLPADGHGAGGGVCPHRCANAVGSDCCRCPEGYGPSTGGKLSPPRRGTPEVAPNPDKGNLPTCCCTWGSGGGGARVWGVWGTGRSLPDLGSRGRLRGQGWGAHSAGAGRALCPCPTACRHRASAGDGTLLLLVRAVTLQTRTVSNNAPSAAQRPRAQHGPRRGPPLSTAGTLHPGAGGVGLHLPRVQPRAH